MISINKKNIFGFVFLLLSAVTYAEVLMQPTSYSKDLYKLDILDGTYNKTIDHPNKFLDFKYGDRVANTSQITNAILSWAEQSERLQVVEYAKSHEGRSLFALYISSPKNINRLDEIKSNVGLLSDARKINDSKARELIAELPAIAWMAYSIHGNETSGADAALGIIYHLIASTDQEIVNMLDNMVVIVDPMMNPDGRDRFAKSLEQYRGTAPNYDDQSLLHTGDWPYGRTNHYYFDLNRDWFYLTQPETQGRVKLINAWRPQILVDAHEMGAQDTFMTGPAREPINKNMDTDIIKWGNVFAKNQANEFDKRDWRFYTGEWHEDLYPGYSFYVNFRGTLGILYEQSRMSEDGVRRPEGTIQSYKESVHHQFVSTISNLRTLNMYSKEMYVDFWEGRKYNVSRDSKFANQSFVIMPTKNKGRLNSIAKKLKAQGIEIFTNQKTINVKSALKQTGDLLENVVVPVGSMIIPNRQPEAPLISAILEFDAEIDNEVLVEERQENLRDGSSIMYDTTAFNFSMMYGLNALTVPENITNNLIAWEPTPINIEVNKDAIMWATDGADDRSVAFAARLMEEDIEVRIIDTESILSNYSLSRGSVVVIAMDNPEYDNLDTKILTIASELGIAVASINSGYGAEELPDWGGRHFRLLERPQIAILSHAGFNSYDVGVSWWSIDHHLGIRHSQINSSLTNYADLRRYNTIVIPSGYNQISEYQKEALLDWINQGGTLIAHNQSTRLIANADMTNTQLLPNALENSNQYNFDLMREILALDINIDREKIHNNKVDTNINYPWETSEEENSEEMLMSRDKWQSIFMPSGAMVAGRVDQKHWLSFGTDEMLPLLYGNSPVQMTGDNVEAVVRIGELVPNSQSNNTKRINWSSIPKGYDLNVRMSGLVWPEAAQRIANSAYLTREKIGKGQVILFSGEPNFRGAARGTNRLWLNALVYGAGLGTDARINP